MVNPNRPLAEPPIPERLHTESKQPEASPIARLLIDLGPLVVFFAAFALTGKNVFLATGIFMAATAAVMLFSKLRFGAISPMLWFSGVMVLVLGGLTLWLHNETFIKIKPTIYYCMLSGVLFFGLWSGRPTLKLAFGAAYPGLDARGWALLTRNWAFFFLALAAANEAVWRNFTTEFWLGYKFWGALPATLIFGAANIPMLLKHGMTRETLAEEPPIPHQD